ncbi:MAG: hypothetical protein ACPGO3_03255 [Magnetospiraceae bacterium]
MKNRPWLPWPMLVVMGLLAASMTSAQAAQQMNFICDLGGVAAQMRVNVEYVAQSGTTWSGGPTPNITGVVPTGQYTLYTVGEVRSPNAYYTFQGENGYADFTDMVRGERFRVQFVPQQGGMWMIINPFQPPQWQGRHFCRQVG